MTVSGFSFIRNGLKYDYPFEESIRSVLPLCDEFILAVGKSEDDTLRRAQAINKKIKIIETVWDDTLREGGAILAQQTNIALQRAQSDWAFYLQADEIVHEQELPIIKSAMEEHKQNSEVEGLLFNYIHFYGSHQYIGNSRRWYRNEVRIIRPGIGIQSWGDAQGFRRNGRKLRVKALSAHIYHYGWVKPPEAQQAKQKSFNKLWHSDDWVREHVGNAETYDYSRGGRLSRFEGSHPSVMQKRVASENWKFEYDPIGLREPFKEKILNQIEEWTGWRIGEYKNYELL